MNVTLYIENLAASATEEELKTLFTQIGSSIAIRMNEDRLSAELTDDRFPITSTSSEADKNIGRFDIHTWNGRTWRVRLTILGPQPGLTSPNCEP